MGRTISIASQKGGVGKTTTALNLGYSLCRLGHRVLLVDCDPQGGMALATNLRKRTSAGLIDMMRDGAPVSDVVMTTRNPALAVAGIGRLEPEEVFFLEQAARAGGFGYALKKVGEGFDYTILDAPAGVGAIVTAALSASDGVLLTVVPRVLTLKSLPSFLSLVRHVREGGNPDLALEGVLVTMFSGSESDTAITRELRESFPPEVFFRTMIPLDDTFEQASIRSVPVALQAGGDEAAKRYRELALELKERELLREGGSDDEHLAGLF